MRYPIYETLTGPKKTEQEEEEGMRGNIQTRVSIHQMITDYRMYISHTRIHTHPSVFLPPALSRWPSMSNYTSNDLFSHIFIVSLLFILCVILALFPTNQYIFLQLVGLKVEFVMRPDAALEVGGKPFWGGRGGVQIIQGNHPCRTHAGDLFA